MARARRLIPLAGMCAAFLGCERADGPGTLEGSSALVPLFQAAARDHRVPEEILAAIAFEETGFVAPTALEDLGHVPESFGVTGLPAKGRVRSVELASALLGVPKERVEREVAINIAGAAAILRQLADLRFGSGKLLAQGSRDAWMEVVATYFDAGAVGEELALAVRRDIARGLVAEDTEHKTVIIRSFEDLFPDRRPKILHATSALRPDYPPARFVAASTANYRASSRTSADIDRVVIHTVQGSYAGCISWFQNPSASVSAHYVVRRSDGAITQMVEHKDSAWHVGSTNGRSVGIEHEGYISDPNNYTDPMLQTSADLTRWLCDTLGIPKDRAHIIGHVEAPGATHTDPGPYWPWARYMNLVTGQPSMPPGQATIQGVVYRGADPNDRYPSAMVLLDPGSESASPRVEDAFWSFTVPPGTYEITAAASGFSASRESRTVVAGDSVWASIRLEPTVQDGELTGLVTDASSGAPIALANVSIASGPATQTGSDGTFSLTVGAQTSLLTVEKAGYSAHRQSVTVVAGQRTELTIGLSPPAANNRAPEAPIARAPSDGLVLRAVRPRFFASGLSDPDADPITLLVEISADAAGTTVLSEGTVSVPAGANEVSWRHPADDLPSARDLYWRVRASDGSLTGGWSLLQHFVSAEGGDPATSTPWATDGEVASPLGLPPPAPRILSPSALSALSTFRPVLVAEDVRDPDGDLLSYRFDLAADDIFETGLLSSELLGGPNPSWELAEDLEAGTYYARVRAADPEAFGPYGPTVQFSIRPSTIESPSPRSATGRVSGGCAAPIGDPQEGLAFVLIVVTLFVARRSFRVGPPAGR